jgi:hypothetical protein
VCTASDLLRTDLMAPPGSGISVEVAVVAGDCTMVARIVVASDAPAGTVPLQITRDNSPWGKVELQVTGSFVREGVIGQGDQARRPKQRDQS